MHVSKVENLSSKNVSEIKTEVLKQVGKNRH